MNAPSQSTSWFGISAGVLALLLSGCATFAPVQDSTRFFTLTSVHASGHFATVAPEGAPVVGVRVTEVAGHLRRPGIAVRTGSHEIQFSPENRWAGRLDDAVERAVAGGIQREAGSRVSVIPSPRSRGGRPDVLIEIDLLALEGQRAGDGSALLIADWRIVGQERGMPVASGRFRAEKSGWDGQDYDRLAALLEAGVNDLAAAVAEPALNETRRSTARE